MKENYITIPEDDILILPIRTKDGKDTGESLTFDLGDVELYDKLKKLVEEDKKNKKNFQEKSHIIEKKYNKNNKNELNKFQDEMIEATKIFLKKEENVYNMFLGENGVKKLLNGRNITWDSLLKVDEIINKQIVPYINKGITDMKERMKNKYASNLNIDFDSEVLK